MQNVNRPSQENTALYSFEGLITQNEAFRAAVQFPVYLFLAFTVNPVTFRI